MKILYYTDYLLNEYNSVRDILFNFLLHPEVQNDEQVVVHSGGRIGRNYCWKEEEMEGYKTYYTVNIASEKKRGNGFLNGITTKILDVLQMNKIRGVVGNNKYFKKILKKENPNLVIFLTFTPNKRISKICDAAGVPYAVCLYDTYVSRPNMNQKKVIRKEKYIINNSIGYFVPNFFYGDYQKYYQSSKLKEYCLPLLIDKEEVLKAYKNSQGEAYEFTYFGQIQSFRNRDTTKKIFEQLKTKLDVFTTQSYKDDGVFFFHPALTQGELYSVIVRSKYLVAFDNSAPYEHYLPSKAYLYVSFTKPVIVFGDNQTSAIRKFFEGYPFFYYQNIYEPLDGLMEFLQKELPQVFDESVYSKYTIYSKQDGIEPLAQVIKECKKDN
ncbi:MAG: hypothetical protein IJV85_00555 [Clostridia bacterium]|nr:hypothetical protein [Clostridia bacterium]